jgi:hypothetical protein
MAGDIVISIQGEDTQTWQALCDAYTAKNPNANCSVELKPGEGYQDWIRTQFAGGTPRPSWVNGNVVADLMAPSSSSTSRTIWTARTPITKANHGATASIRPSWPSPATQQPASCTTSASRW